MSERYTPKDQSFSSQELAKELTEQKTGRARKWAARIGLALTLLPAPSAVRGERDVPTPPGEKITTPLNPETEAELGPMNAEEKANLIEQSGYSGLEEHQLEVVNRFEINGDHVSMVGLDGAKPAVSKETLSEYLRQFEKLAESGKKIDFELALGNGETVSVPYTLRPADKSERYFIFTGPDVDTSKLSPHFQSGNAPEGYTTDNYPGVGEVSVSIIREVEGRMAGTPVSRSEYLTGLEACQSSIRVELAPEVVEQLRQSRFEGLERRIDGTDSGDQAEKLRMLGQEVICHSYPLAVIAKRQGMHSGEYRNFVYEYGSLSLYQNLDVRPIILEDAEYNGLQT